MFPSSKTRPFKILTQFSSQGSLSKYHGKHPLGSRARAAGLVIRFEVPFDIWCGTCGELIPHGRRFNAVKSEVGKWHSSPIFSFRFKCNACSAYIDIHTDPQNSDFTVISGGKRKAEATEEDETARDLPKLNNAEERERLSDPFARLEHVHDDMERGKTAVPHLEDIQEAVERRYADSVKTNRLLRTLHRAERKQAISLKQEAKERGFGIPLLPTSIEDEAEARIALALKSSPIASPPSVNPTTSPSSTSSHGISNHTRHETKLMKQTNAARRAATESSIFATTHSSRARVNTLMAQLKQKKVDVSIFTRQKKL